MDQKNIDFFMATCHDKFKPLQLQQVQEMLRNADDSKFIVLQSISFVEPSMCMILAIIAGGWGIDRFYLKDNVNGVLKLITAGGCGIWWIIDCLSATERAQAYNFQQLKLALGNYNY